MGKLLLLEARAPVGNPRRLGDCQDRNCGSDWALPSDSVVASSVYSRISEAIRQTADSFQNFVRDYHRAMDPAAVRMLLAASGEQLQPHADRATAQEVLAAIEAVAARERRLLVGSLREMAASALQQQQLLIIEQQRQRGLGPLQRLQQNARNRLLATRQGAAALRGWKRVGNAASAMGRYVGQLPLLRQLLQSPVAALWRERKPVDISLHYMSPTAFGLAAVK